MGKSSPLFSRTNLFLTWAENGVFSMRRWGFFYRAPLFLLDSCCEVALFHGRIDYPQIQERSSAILKIDKRSGRVG